jgi:lysophospholipase L1-like esterase
MSVDESSGGHGRDVSGRRHAGRALAGVLGLLLGVSLVANAVLVRKSLESYKETNAVRLDPLGLKAYASERARPEYPADDGHPLLEFFGDSRALMWGKPTVPGYTVTNRGVGWQTTAQILGRVERDVIDLHPDVVVVEAGVNDLKMIAQFPERRAEIVADCEANVAKIVDACNRAGENVILATIFEIGDVDVWRRPFWSEDVSGAVREVNAYFATLAGGRTRILDANGALDDGRGHVQKAMQADYLHVNERGYAALNERLLPLLSASGKSEARGAAAP